MCDAAPVGVRLREYIAFRNSYQPGAVGRWSQARLARVAGISDKHMSKIITGRSQMSAAMAVRLERDTDGDLDAVELMRLTVEHAVAVARSEQG